jgi:hypothetical protein
MDDSTLSQILLRMARQDSFDNVGRLLVSDVRSGVGDRALTAEKILQVWGQHFPSYEADHRSGNVILIYWDGRGTAQSERNARVPVTQGRIIDPEDKAGEEVVE